ncbi:hypothetical protein MPSEU_000373100 [Mayamaea pseudoterrestris]|nr:hypothetical protein MPSEU_000373100 [Mayamaea pseudoterrestris]
MGDTISTLLFQPPNPSKLKEHKIVWLKTRRNKRVPGFYISYRRQGGVESCRSLTADEIRDSRPEEGITLLYSHANAEDLGSIYPWCKFLSKMLQVNLFAYDYAGYGMAADEGPPSEEDCYADIEAAYDYLRHSLRVPAQNIVLYGRSLGSGPSCYLATKTALESQSKPVKAHDDEAHEPVGGLILHAPFLSVYRVVIDPGCTLPGDKFVNIDLLPMIRSPTILIHGTSDQIVPFYHSERLFEAIPKDYQARPLYIEGMSHNNVHAQVRPMFVDRLTDFLRDHVWPHVVIRRRHVVSSSMVRKRFFKAVETGQVGNDEVPECEEVSDFDEESVEENRVALVQQ